MGYIDLGTFSVKKMKDLRTSYVELLKLKLAAKEELVDNWLQQAGLAPERVLRMQKAFASFDSVRKMVTGYPGWSWNMA